MHSKTCLALAAFSLLAAAPAYGQIVNGVMTVTGAEMHWWAGVACDATARLYDVDEDSVVFKKFDKTKKYDQGTVTFRARKGALVDLDKLHESIWATRLSGGTRSGIVSLDVTVVGKIVQNSGETVLKVSNSSAEFVLQKHSEDEHANAFGNIQNLAGDGSVVRVTGRIDNYVGRWPAVLKRQPAKPRRILVTKVERQE